MALLNGKTSHLNGYSNGLQNGGGVNGINVLQNAQAAADMEYLRVQKNLFTDPDRQSEWAKKKLIWVPHEKEGFVSGSIVKDDDESTIVVEIVETGQRLQLSRDDYQKANPPKFDKVLFFPCSTF